MSSNHSESIEERYTARTEKSRKMFEVAKQYLPGGDTRTSVYFSPYPTFFERGEGCRIFDVDGNCYIDFLNNYSSLIHGHAHPAIVKAISEQTAKGTVFAGPTDMQVHFAKTLSGRLPSLERIRFCNSGTEATLMAIRAAKAFTGRDKILKLDGGYHGTHDAAVVSLPANTNRISEAENPGLFRGIASEVLSTPANDIAAAAELFDRYGKQIAAVIVELVMGGAGIIPLEKEFIRFLSGAAKSCGALLILDEIITFRLSYGGAQELFGVAADLTTLGKIIGGGLPVGAFGGRAEVMSQFDPASGTLVHSGTFNGNSATLAAGMAALELFTREAIARVDELGNKLREGLREIFDRTGWEGQVTGIGSLLGLHFTRSKINNYRAALDADRRILPLLHLSLMNRGVFVAPRGFLCISTAMGESEIQEFLRAFEDSLMELKHRAIDKSDSVLSSSQIVS